MLTLQVAENCEYGMFLKYIVDGLKIRYDKTAGKRYFGNSQNHYVKLRIMQFLNVVLEKIDLNDLEMFKEWLFENLTTEAHQISVKILMQWLYSRVLIKITKNYEEIIEDLLKKAKDLQGTSISCLFPVFYHLSKHCQEFEVVSKVMKLLATLSMGANFGIRYGAQVNILG